MVARVVLQRAGDDFRSRSRSAIDQDDDRLAAGEVAGLGVVALRLVGMAAAGRDDLAALEERVGDRDRLIEQAAGIVAQVEDVALAPCPRRCPCLIFSIADLEAVEGLLVERGDADVADLALASASAPTGW